MTLLYLSGGQYCLVTSLRITVYKKSNHTIFNQKNKTDDSIRRS